MNSRFPGSDMVIADRLVAPFKFPYATSWLAFFCWNQKICR